MKSKKILIVDDEKQILEMMTELLEENGFKSGQALTGEEALKMLESEAYSLVISDVRMPEMDGFELLEEIKARYPKTKMIMMTGYTDDYDISDALILGAEDYITKPFDEAKIMLAVKNALKN